MTIILTFVLAYIVMTTLFLLMLFSAQQRSGEFSVEVIREYAYTAAPEARHRSSRLSSWRV